MPPCPSCQAEALHEGCEGWRILPETDEVCPAWEAHRLTLERERRLSELGIPAKYATATAAGYLVEGDPRRAKAKRAAVEWFVGWREGRPERGLYLHGPPGTGKTHLAVALLRGCCATYGVSGRFVSLPGLAASLRERVGEERTSSDLLSPVLSADLVVLDELGAQRLTDWWEELLYNSINTRYSECRPTLFTSELPAEKLKLPARLVSRVAEMASGVSLEGCEDWRRLDRGETARRPRL